MSPVKIAWWLTPTIKKYVRFPLVPLQSIPVQYRGIYQIVTYYGKLGAVETVYRETLSYCDGI